MEWPACTNAKEIKVFLGLSHGYYRKYLKNYAAIVSPLTDLLQANTPFIWTTECQQAMNTIKQLLTTAPILALPRFDRPFILDTDCSTISMGSVLSQLDDDRNESVICYSSKKLTDRQKNYCVTRRELLAIIYYLKYCKHYLLGTKCLLRTDHAALQWLKRIREPVGQQLRWLEILQEFTDLTFLHRPDIAHGNADAMSRRLVVVENRKLITSLIQLLRMHVTSTRIRRLSILFR